MFCQKCGKEILDGSAVCIHCGCAVAGEKTKVQKKQVSKGNQILGAIIGGLVALIVFAIVFPLVL